MKTEHTNTQHGAITMRNLTFGIEIETIPQTRERIANAIQSIVGGRVEHIGIPYCYDPWHVTDTRGRIWKVVADSSLNAPKELQAEVVSPILHYEDIEELQEVVRALRHAGAKVDFSTAIHLHIGAAPFNAKALCNLVKMVHKQEDLLYHALGVSEARRNRWCKEIDEEFLHKIEKQRPTSLEQLNKAWYGYHNTEPAHYDLTRYKMINLHNVWYRQTVEFRAFEGTLHAGKVKAYIQLVLAISSKALQSKTTSSKKRPLNPATAKYDMRIFLLSVGMLGDEFKTARLHLLANLEGSAAWKHGRPQRAQNIACAA